MIGAFSPSEALGTWNGLGGYAALRELLVWLPRLIIFASWLRFLWLYMEDRDRHLSQLLPLGRYLFTSLLILALFWPESLLLSGATPQVAATDVISQVAEEDGAPLQSAAQFGQTGSSVLVPLPVQWTLQGANWLWIQLARWMHEAAMRPFSATLPMSWLLRHKVDGQTQAAIRDWTHKCVLPAKARLLAGGTQLTYENTLPFGNSPLVNEMANMTIVPARGGFWSFPSPQDARRCDTYGLTIEGRVLTSIQTQRSPGGLPLAQVWADALDMEALDAAQMIVYREVLQSAGPEIPPPSLIGQYGAVRGLRVIGSVLGGLIPGLSGGTSGALAGSVSGAVKGVGNELGNALEAMSGMIEPALFVTLWAPEILGMAQQVALSLFVFVLVWCLIPGHQIRPLVAYLFILLVLYSSPFWWASIELWTESLGDLRPSVVHNPREWLRIGIGILIGQTVGIGIVLVAMTTVLFLVSGGGSVLALVRLTRGRT